MKDSQLCALFVAIYASPYLPPWLNKVATAFFGTVALYLVAHGL